MILDIDWLCMEQTHSVDRAKLTRICRDYEQIWSDLVFDADVMGDDDDRRDVAIEYLRRVIGELRTCCALLDELTL